MKRMKGEDCAIGCYNGEENRCETGNAENCKDFNCIKRKHLSNKEITM